MQQYNYAKSVCDRLTSFRRRIFDYPEPKRVYNRSIRPGWRESHRIWFRHLFSALFVSRETTQFQPDFHSRRRSFPVESAVHGFHGVTALYGENGKSRRARYSCRSTRKNWIAGRKWRKIERAGIQAKGWTNSFLKLELRNAVRKMGQKDLWRKTGKNASAKI